LRNIFPEKAEELFAQSEKQAKEKYKLYKKLSEVL